MIEALKCRGDLEGQLFEGGAFDVAEAGALALGSFGPEAKAAVPALIDALKTREKDDANWTVRRAAALALGEIGPDAKAAIPTLREALNEKPCSIRDGVVIALYRLVPDGKTVAENWVEPSRWVESSRRPWQESASLHSFRGRREIVLGAIGRTSLEADALTRRCLKILEFNMAIDFHDGWEDRDHLEEYFEAIGRLGVGGRLATPRLEELRMHRNPWVRLWATETLEKIRPSRS